MLIKFNNCESPRNQLVTTGLLFLILLGTHNNNGFVDGINYKEFFANVNPYLATELVHDYARFSSQVNRALGIQDDSLNGTTSASPSRKDYDNNNFGVRTGSSSSSGLDSYSPETNYKSAIGVSNILAVARENIWDNLELADPTLEEIVRSAPSSLPGFMGSLLKSAEHDYNTKIRSIIFTPTWIRSGLRLSELKCEIKQTFFDLPEQAMDAINNVIHTRFPDVQNFPDFLTTPLPLDTESLIVNMKQQRGYWPANTGYVGSTIFNGTGYEERVEMFELRGTFSYFQDQKYIYVTVPLKLTKLALTLVLAENPARLQYRQGEENQEAHFRLHLPVKTFISRNPIKTDSRRTCDEQRNQNFGNCMEFLDTLSYTSFNPTEFQFINLNAGVVRRQGNLYQNSHQNRLRSTPILDKWRSFVPSRRNNLRHQNNFNYQKIWKWKLPSAQSNSYANNNFYNYNSQKTIALVFNRPFHYFVRSTV